MIAMKIIYSIILSTILIAILSFTITTAFTENRIIYSVKFICIPTVGPDRETVFVPQTYKTVINVQNPNPNQTAFVEKKAVIAQSEDEERGPNSTSKTDRLRPDQALSINCNDIHSLFNNTMPTIGDGFVVLKSNLKLDVSAVYTTQSSIDVEYIQPFQPRM
jgi:hypothetical protein